MRDYHHHGLVQGGEMLNDSQLLKDDPFKKDRFRQKILDKLGSVGALESGENIPDLQNFEEGLSQPSDMEYGQEITPPLDLGQKTKAAPPNANRYNSQQPEDVEEEED